jgi:ATP/ADP translocase
MIITTPPIGILIDLPFGLLMWASFVHFLLNIVMNEDSAFVLMRLLRGLNAPIYAVINLIKPAFIISRLMPLYAAGTLFILRYYVLPLVVGFDVWSFSDMPLERLLLSAKSDLGL